MNGIASEETQDIVTQAIENQKVIKEIQKQAETDRQQIRDQQYDLRYNVYYDQIRKLENERDEKIAELETQLDQREKSRDVQVHKLHEAVDKVSRIVAFLQADLKDITIDDDDIQTYRGAYKENLGFLYEDPHLQIRLYIVENDKPTNKYSLIVYGKTHINLNELWRDYYSYGLHIQHDSYGYCIRMILKDLPTIEGLKNWLEKRRDKIISKILGNYPSIRDEFDAVRSNYRIDDFKPFMEQEIA